MSARGQWQQDKQVAKAILYDRTTRRRWLARMMVVAVAQLVLGLWVIDGWLAEGMWRFIFWWGACAAVTLWLMLFALFDALMVIKEEKNRS